MIHYCFPSGGNTKLAEALVHRAIELGYRKCADVREVAADCLCITPESDDSNIYHASSCGGLDGSRYPDDYQRGCLYALFHGTQYAHKGTRVASVKLNDNYSAEVSRDTVKVGCQTFPASKIAELAEALEKVQ
jgi:hypothetical protein